MGRRSPEGGGSATSEESGPEESRSAERITLNKALSEAQKMKAKIESGKADNYDEAEKLVENDAQYWREWRREQEVHKRTAVRLDTRVLDVLNEVGLGLFKASPRNNARTEVGTTPDGKLSGWLYQYAIEDEPGWPLFDTNEHFERINEEDIVTAIAIAFRENGLGVYKSRDGLIVVGRDEKGHAYYKKSEKGNYVKMRGTSLHRLYNSCSMVISTKEHGSTKIYSDGVDMLNAGLYSQGGKLMYQTFLYDDKSGKYTIERPQECEPFTMTAEEFKKNILAREVGRGSKKKG